MKHLDFTVKCQNASNRHWNWYFSSKRKGFVLRKSNGNRNSLDVMFTKPSALVIKISNHGNNSAKWKKGSKQWMLYATLFATLRNLRKWSLESMTHTKLYFRHAVAVFYNSISLFIIHFLVNSITNRKLYLAKSCNSNKKKPFCRFFHGKIK